MTAPTSFWYLSNQGSEVYGLKYELLNTQTERINRSRTEVSRQLLPTVLLTTSVIGEPLNIMIGNDVRHHLSLQT